MTNIVLTLGYVLVVILAMACASAGVWSVIGWSMLRKAWQARASAIGDAQMLKKRLDATRAQLATAERLLEAHRLMHEQRHREQTARLQQVDFPVSVNVDLDG